MVLQWQWPYPGKVFVATATGVLRKGSAHTIAVSPLHCLRPPPSVLFLAHPFEVHSMGSARLRVKASPHP